MTGRLMIVLAVLLLLWAGLLQTAPSAAARPGVAPVPSDPSTASRLARGTLRITIVTPAGVPATVRFNHLRLRAVAVKPAAGTSKVVATSVVPGSWKAASRAFTYNGRYYLPTTTPATPVVVAGRTTQVKVVWRAARTASGLTVTDLRPTSVTLGFVRPSSTVVRVRYAAGTAAPRTVTAGLAAAVSGSTAKATGLKPGSPYSFSVFTKAGTRWLGPISVTAGTPAATTDDKVTYVADSDTVLAAPTSAVATGARALGGGRVSTVPPSGAAPVPDQPYVIPATPALPGGFVGRVLYVRADGHVVLSQASLSEAFSQLHVPQTAIVGPTATSSKQRLRAVNGTAVGGTLDCGDTVAPTIAFDTDVDFSGSGISFDLSTRHVFWHDVPTGITLDARLQVNVSATVSASVSVATSCTLSWATITVPFAAGPVPMMLTFTPQSDLGISTKADFESVGVDLTAGVSTHLHAGLTDPSPDVDVTPFASLTPKTPTAQDQGLVRFTVSQANSVSVGLGPGLGSEAAGVQAGLEGTVTPLESDVDFVAKDGMCAELTAKGSVGIGLFVDVWVGRFHARPEVSVSKPLAYGGPWRLLDACTDPWVGTATWSISRTSEGSMYHLTESGSTTWSYANGVATATGHLEGKRENFYLSYDCNRYYLDVVDSVSGVLARQVPDVDGIHWETQQSRDGLTGNWYAGFQVLLTVPSGTGEYLAPCDGGAGTHPWSEGIATNRSLSGGRVDDYTHCEGAMPDRGHLGFRDENSIDFDFDYTGTTWCPSSGEDQESHVHIHLTRVPLDEL